MTKTEQKQNDLAAKFDFLLDEISDHFEMLDAAMRDFEHAKKSVANAADALYAVAEQVMPKMSGIIGHSDSDFGVEDAIEGMNESIDNFHYSLDELAKDIKEIRTVRTRTKEVDEMLAALLKDYTNIASHVKPLLKK